MTETEPRCGDGLWKRAGLHRSKRGKTWKFFSHSNFQAKSTLFSILQTVALIIN